MWNQMVSSGVVGDTMYLCLGNGGDVASTSAAAQAGVVVFGR